MSGTRRFDRAAIAAFYQTHTRAETCAAFGCSEGLVVRAARDAGLHKQRWPKEAARPASAFDAVAKETGVKPREIRRRALAALAGEPVLLRNLIDEVA